MLTSEELDAVIASKTDVDGGYYRYTHDGTTVVTSVELDRGDFYAEGDPTTPPGGVDRTVFTLTEGNDYWPVGVRNSGDDHVRALGGNDDVAGGRGSDLLDGGEGADTLKGDGGDDYLYGRGGHDRLDGGADDDELHGGAGNDTLEGGMNDDLLDGGSGHDVLWANAETEFTGGVTVPTDDAEQGRDELLGGTGNDTLHGDNGRDYLDGEDGADHLFGYAGTDMLIADKGDTIDGGDGMDTVSYAGNADKVHVILDRPDGTAPGAGDAFEDVEVVEHVIGSEGHDTLTGGTSANKIEGRGGNDTLDGGAENDMLDGGAGNDALAGGDGMDELVGGAGNDTISGNGANTKNDGAPDTAATAEVTPGANARDMLTGGSGSDTFTWGDNDVVKDFNTGDDVIDHINVYSGSDVVDPTFAMVDHDDNVNTPAALQVTVGTESMYFEGLTMSDTADLVWT